MGKMAIDSAIFDLDGIVTKTAVVHARAWKKAFDEYLLMREKRDGEPFKEFTHEHDYREFVDGRPRYEGVKTFLASRNIDIPFGSPEDSPEMETVCGLGNSKNVMFRKVLEEHPPEIYHSTVELIQDLKKHGVRVGVASSSKNCRYVLQAAGLSDLFETRVDGAVAAKTGLKGKPEGDIFVTAARNLDSSPARSVVFEDAISGVKAGRNGGFGLVVGIAREDNLDDLLANGADIATTDFEYITCELINKWFDVQPAPLFGCWDSPELHNSRLEAVKLPGISVNPTYYKTAGEVFCSGKKPVFFLDYDGTLTPIVDRPDWAVLSEQMRDVLVKLKNKYTVAAVSGRMREDVENLIKIPDMFYAGSHGFDIKGPGGFSMVQPFAEKVIPVVDLVIEELKDRLGHIEGGLVEEKKFSAAFHYRLVDEKYMEEIIGAIDDIVARRPELRLMHGKKVFEILPAIDWNKGMAVRWIMKALDIDWDKNVVVYIGDDVTDDDAFRVVRARGYGVLVSAAPRGSSADFGLKTPDDVMNFFEKLI